MGLVEFNDLERFVATFSERTLKAMVKGIQDDKEIELSGIVDWMIARGRATPRTPYFFIHEYKQEESGTKSNRGQLLATMLAAQELNDDGKPIYGPMCWDVIGSLLFCRGGSTACQMHMWQPKRAS